MGLCGFPFGFPFQNNLTWAEQVTLQIQTPKGVRFRYEIIVSDLCENLDSLDEPDAKAAMIWIVGEYAKRTGTGVPEKSHFRIVRLGQNKQSIVNLRGIEGPAHFQQKQKTKNSLIIRG